MMAPSPADRFASYDELIRAIELSSVEQMRPAGLWVRSMATGVDLLLAGVSAVLVERLFTLAFRVPDNGVLMFAAYWLYATGFIARRGRTPGQSLFELEVVDITTGARPRWSRAGLRVGLAMAGPTGTAAATFLHPASGAADVVRGFVMFALAATPAFALLWASLRSPAKRTFWDRRSDTLVRYRTRRATAI
jgi:hypothetical protein